MPEEWTGDIVKKMHMNQITNEEIGMELGYSKSYVGMILNGKRKPAGAQEKMERAVDDIIARRNEEE